MLKQLYDRIISTVNKGNDRSVTIKKNILGSFVLKSISILVSLQIVPLTLNYVNPTKYGIWLTLSSIIAWLAYFDLGFCHGFRNRFTEAKSEGNIKLAKEYVSTTYAILFILFFSIFIIISILNNYINWSSILNVDELYSSELKSVFGILSAFFCIDMVSKVFTTMLTADQKPALTSLIQTGGQVLAFVCIYILTRTTSGSLIYLALAFTGIPCVLLFIVSLITYSYGKYKVFAPSIKYIRFNLSKKILGLGGQFFIIMISMLFIFQFLNIIISRIEGPEIVTQYNIAYKYFNVANMLSIIVITPFWSAFTDAYIKRDNIWMKNMLNKLEKMLIWITLLLICMLIFSKIMYNFWIGDTVIIPISISISVAIYVFSQIVGSLYMYLINGTSKVRLQLIVYLLFAMISVPLITLFCKLYGVIGALFIPTVVFLIQSFIARKQINKIISGEAKGIWNR